MAVKKLIAILLFLATPAFGAITGDNDGACYTTTGAPSNNWWEFTVSRPSVITLGTTVTATDSSRVVRCFTSWSACDAMRLTYANMPAGSQPIGPGSTISWTWNVSTCVNVH